LADQKMASLTPMPQWWLDCLTQGRFAGAAGFRGSTFETLSLDVVRSSLAYYCKSRNINQRLPDDRTIVKELNRFAPSLLRGTDAEGNTVFRCGQGLAVLRAEWERFIGGKVDFLDTIDVFN